MGLMRVAGRWTIDPEVLRCDWTRSTTSRPRSTSSIASSRGFVSRSS